MMYIVESLCQQETNWVSGFVYTVNQKDMNVLQLPGRSTQMHFSAAYEGKKSFRQDQTILGTNNSVNPHYFTYFIASYRGT